MQESSGTVKWYDPVKNFGFISSQEGGDVFVHRRSLGEGLEELVDGQEVSFALQSSPRGAEAISVRVTRQSDNPVNHRSRLRPRQFDSRESRLNAGVERPKAPRHIPSNLPKGPIGATVVSLDGNGRFLFVRPQDENYDVYVHGSVCRENMSRIRRGDTVTITLEASARGPRATSLEISQSRG